METSMTSHALSTGKTWTCWSGARGGHKSDLRAGTPLLWGKAERVGAVQPGEDKASGEEKDPGRAYCDLLVPEGPTR